MRNFLEFKKSKIIIYFVLIFNQFVFSANALNIGKLDLINPKKDTIHKKNNDEIDIVNVNETDDYEKDTVV